MAGIATICWDFVPGSLSTLVEYRVDGETAWITPTSPNNPTITNCYSLTIEDNTFYDVRLTTNGISCGPKSTTFQIFRAVGNCCPPGYTLSDDETYCFQTNVTTATPPSSPENTVAKSSIAYGPYGTLIYDPGYNIDGTGTFTQINYSNTFWVNGPGYPTFPGPGTVDGPFNRCGLWAATEADNQTVGFTVCITTPTSGVYYVGIAGDNVPEIVLDGVTIVDMDPAVMGAYLAANGYTALGAVPTEATFRFWHIYPVSISAGTHVLEMKCLNTFSIAAMGAEIYNLTSAQIQSATSYVSMGGGLVFSTKDFVGQPVQVGTGGVGYTCPSGYSLVLCDGPAYCTQTLTTPTIECTTTSTTTTTTTTL